MRIFIVSLFSCILLLAEVPHTFVSGEAAKASEVNENFTFLNNKVNSIENNSSVTGTSSNYIPDLHGITYQKKSSSIGETITIENKDYIMTAIPFKEFGTGDKYYLKIPIDWANDTYGWWDFSHARNGLMSDSELLISGFPTNLDYTTDMWGITILKNTTTNKFKLTQKYQINLHFSILVNKTKINIGTPYDYNNIQQEIDNIDSVDYDFTKSVDYDAFVHDDTLLQNIDDWIDYIEIIKID